jgi:hypothetical protein
MKSILPKQTITELELQHDRAQYGAILCSLTLEELTTVYRKDCRLRWQALGTVDNIATALKLYALTPEQQVWLDAHQLDIAAVLKADFPAEFLDEVETLFCESWNATIGAPVFSFKQA